MGLLKLLLKIMILTAIWLNSLWRCTITIIMVFDSLEEAWIRLLILVGREFVRIWGGGKFMVALTDQRFTAIRAQIFLTWIEKLILSILFVFTLWHIILLPFFRLFNLIRIASSLDLLTDASDSVGKYENEDKNVAKSEQWGDIARHLEPTLLVHCSAEKRPNHLT